jgi:hypothetical protein
MTLAGQPNPYGTDLLVTFSGDGNGDVDASGALASGVRVLAQSCVMRQTTTQASLLGAQSECFDLREWISKGMTQAQISAIGSLVTNQLLRDQRITAASVSASFNYGTSKLTLIEQIQSTLGPFTLTVIVGAVTVHVIFGV